MEITFEKQKKELILQLEKLEYNSPKKSYEYLIIKLNNLTIHNIKKDKKQLLHFLVDSYDGNIELGYKISTFLMNW